MTPCLHLDDYLDGRLSESETTAFESHAIDCAACDDALAVGALVAPLREVECPPEVLDRARRAAHRAPDRAPVHGRARTRAWAPIALASMLAIALAFAFWPSTTSEPTPLAETTRDEAPASSETLSSPSDSALASPTIADPQTVAAPPPTPRRTTRSRPAPSATPPAPAPQLSAPPQAPDVAALPDIEPSPEEIDAARRELALAFQLVADAQTRARDAVRDEAPPLSTTIDQALPF